MSEPHSSARQGLPRRNAALGPWALVTGASDGIGAATARALAEAGFDLVVVARRNDRLTALAEEIAAVHRVRAVPIAADLGRRAGAGVFFRALDEEGIAQADIGVAVLAAGFGSTGALADADIGTERDMLDVNCGAVLEMSHALARSMRARGAGQLVLFGSVVGFQGNAFTANYSATKAYVQSLAEGLAAEMRPDGVHVLCVAPGPVASGFAARAGMTMGQAGTPEEVARAITAALGRSGTIRPGFLSKLLGYNLALTPRPLRVRIMSRIMRGMAAPPDRKRQEA